VPVLHAPPTSALSIPGPVAVAVARSGGHHAQPACAGVFIFRRRHRVCATTAGAGGGDRRQAKRGADWIGCAARPHGLSGEGGRRGPSCDTPPPRILIPASPRYFRLPAPAPFRSLQEGHPRRPPRLRAAHASGREISNPPQISLAPSPAARVPPVSLRAGEPPRATCAPRGFLAFDGHLFASHGSPPAKRPRRVVQGAPPLARRPSAAASSPDPRAPS